MEMAKQVWNVNPSFPTYYFTVADVFKALKKKNDGTFFTLL